MFDIMQNVLLIFIEAMCCKIFFETFGEIRHKGWINLIQVMLLFGSMCFYSYALSEYFVLRQIIAISVFSLFMLWHIKISLKKTFILAVLFDALLLAMDYLAHLIITWLSLGGKLLGKQYEIRYILV